MTGTKWLEVECRGLYFFQGAAKYKQHLHYIIDQLVSQLVWQCDRGKEGGKKKLRPDKIPWV